MRRKTNIDSLQVGHSHVLECHTQSLIVEVLEMQSPPQNTVVYTILPTIVNKGYYHSCIVKLPTS